VIWIGPKEIGSAADENIGFKAIYGNSMYHHAWSQRHTAGEKEPLTRSSRGSVTSVGAHTWRTGVLYKICKHITVDSRNKFVALFLTYNYGHNNH
jgi:hypothetical protein